VRELVDKHCGRLRYDFNQRLQEIARDFRQTWIVKIDDTTHSIRQALERALTQKQASAQATTARMGQLEQRLTEILQAESHLLALKERIEATLG
jgi:hypothetical protein